MNIPPWEDLPGDAWKVPTSLHRHAVEIYLGTFGDAIDARVADLAELAQSLIQHKFYGPSIVVSGTALEVMIQYFCIRPIVQGAFLSALWADELSKRIIDAHTNKGRELLVKALRPWGIDLEKISLADGTRLWERVQSVVFKKRNAFVHDGDTVTQDEAALGLKCVQSFRSEVVFKIGGYLGFTPQKTGCWSRVVNDPRAKGRVVNQTYYTRQTPFAK